MSSNQVDFEGNPVREWGHTSQAATEWNPESIEDLTEGTLLTTKPKAYIKDLAWKDDDGTEHSVEKHYAWLNVDDRIMPIRVNKFSMSELTKAYGPELASWHGKRVVVIVDKSKKWPFVIVKPKPEKAAPAKRKGRARR